MLQHALVAALAPEHEIQLAASLDTESKASEFDLLIMDVAGLQEVGGLDKQTLASLHKSKMPTVLIDGAEPVSLPERVGLVRVTAPLGRDELKAALRQCRGGEKNTEANRTEARPKRAPRVAIPKKQKLEETPVAAPDEQVIELTEVVEED